MKINAKKIMQLVGILVGIAIIVMGMQMSALDAPSYGTKSVSNYSFGADFYTEIYAVTYNILGELNNIAGSLRTSFDRVLKALNAGFSMLVISIGMVTTTSFAYLFLKDLELGMGKKKAKATAEAAAVQAEENVTNLEAEADAADVTEAAAEAEDAPQTEETPSIEA